MANHISFLGHIDFFKPPKFDFVANQIGLWGQPYWQFSPALFAFATNLVEFFFKKPYSDFWLCHSSQFFVTGPKSWKIQNDQLKIIQQYY